MRKGSTRLGLFITFCMLLILMVGCSEQLETNTSTVETELNGGQSSNLESDDPISSTDVVDVNRIDVFGTNEDLTDLVTYEHSIVAKDEIGIVKEAIAALSVEHVENWYSLWKNIQFNSINLVEQNVMIDVTINDDARVGSTAEMYMLDSLQHTLFQFDFVQSISITVDGEQVESLMGHVSIEEPMVKQ